MSKIELLLLTLGLVLFHALSVLGAASVSRSRLSRLRDLKESGAGGSNLALKILRRTEAHHLTLQVASFVTALLVGAASFALGATITADMGFGLVDSAGRVALWGLELGVVVVVSFLAVFLSQLGKNIALADPEGVLCKVAIPIAVLSKLIAPLVELLSRAGSAVLGRLGIEVSPEKEIAVSAEDITQMVEVSTKAGEIEHNEAEMIEGIFSVSDTSVREVMTPRRDIVAVRENVTLDELRSTFEREAVSRVLVTGDEIDEVRGVVLVKDLIPLVGKLSSDFRIGALTRDAYFVPSTKKVNDLLDEFRRNAIHFAVVLDEHGAVDGVVTLEDLIEEIVGEIFDEHDKPAEHPIRRSRSGDLLVSGGVRVVELNERAHLSLPEGEYDTIAGLIINRLGRIPRAGDLVVCGNVRIRVEALAQNRITLVRLISPDKPNIVNKLAPQSFEPESSPIDSKSKSDEKPLKAGIGGA